MEAIKQYRIENIEALSEADAAALAEEHITVKGHDCYLVDFAGYFGYSVLVYLHGGYLRHANDYALHHSGKTRDDLRKLYEKKLNNILFTEEEIIAPVANYDEFERRERYLHNHYGMQKYHISIWFIGSDAEREALRKKTETMIYDPVSFAYYLPEDAAFVEHHKKLYLDMIEQEEKQKNSMEYWIGAFYSEMCDHEYGINWQGDYDVISCFGNIPRNVDCDDVKAMFDAVQFNDVQRAAYAAARRKYAKAASENNWF